MIAARRTTSWGSCISSWVASRTPPTASRWAPPHRDRGTALPQRGRDAEAESACRRALELEPQSAAAWFQVGNACKARGELEQAVECYRSAIGRDPGLVDATGQLAFVLYKLGRYAEARASHAAALAARPGLAGGHP